MSVPILAEIPTPRKEVTPTGASQTGSVSLATSPIISASDPFVALSQVVKDGSSLVVTPSSIPSSATRGPDANLSFHEGSEEVLKDFKDEPIMKTRIFYFNEDSDGGGQKAKAIGMCLSSLANLLFLFFLSFPGTSL